MENTLLDYVEISNCISIDRYKKSVCTPNKSATLEREFQQYRRIPEEDFLPKGVFLNVQTIVPDCEQGFYTDIKFEDNIWYIHPQEKVPQYGFEELFSLGCGGKNWRNGIWIAIPNGTLRS